MDRRKFLKTSAASAVVVGGAAALGSGIASGASPLSHHGWETNETNQYFDREPFEVSEPTYKKIGTVSRASGFDYVFKRRSTFQKYLVNYEEGRHAGELLKELGVNKPEDATYSILSDKDLVDYYKSYEDKNYFQEDIRYYLEILPFRMKMSKEVAAKGDDILHKAFFDGYTSIQGAFSGKGAYAVTSKEYDFEGVSEKKQKIKNPKEMSKLIKKVATLFGSPIVRITKLNPDWVYDTHMGGRGYKPKEKIDVPKHWKYAIVVGSPMEWDSFKSNPSFGHSMDGYMNATIYADRLTKYIKTLGYPARPNSPMHGYDMVLPPILVDAGVGEQGRTGTCITPDFGGNFRPAVVVTDLPLEPDKPIDVNIKKFCKSCKICAEQCPSQSISFDDVTNVGNRGYEGWQINNASCLNYWMTVPVSGSCRICVTVCPFSKQSGWIHKMARDVAVRDRTGLTAKMLTWMEKNFFGEKDANEYVYELGSYEYPTVKEIPWWLVASDFVEL